MSLRSTSRIAPATPSREVSPASCAWAWSGSRVCSMVAFMTERRAIGKILDHLGLPSTGPPAATPTSSRFGPCSLRPRITCSKSRGGNAHDNAAMESWFW